MTEDDLNIWKRRGQQLLKEAIAELQIAIERRDKAQAWVSKIEQTVKELQILTGEAPPPPPTPVVPPAPIMPAPVVPICTCTYPDDAMKTRVIDPACPLHGTEPPVADVSGLRKRRRSSEPRGGPNENGVYADEE